MSTNKEDASYPADPERHTYEFITSRMIPVLHEQADRMIMRNDVDGALARINQRIADGWKVVALESLIAVEEGFGNEGSGGLTVMVRMEKEG